MNNELLNYVKQVFELHCFIYQQDKVIEGINSRIASLKATRMSGYYKTTPDQYPEFYVRSSRVIRALWFAIMLGISFWLCRSIMTKYDFLHMALNGFEHGFGDWFSALPMVIAFIVGIFLFIFLLILGLLFKFWPVSFVLLGIPISWGVSGLITGFILKGPKNTARKKYAEEYGLQMAEKNENIKKNNSMVQSNVNKQIDSLQREANFIDERRKRAEECLKKYYDMDIIYKKYRHMFAIGCFVEYLESGRCDSLQGAHGAYNLYEDEYYKNTIVHKLDQGLERMDRIIYKLDAVIAEVHKLNTSINTINLNVESLNRQFDVALQKVDGIEKNIAIMSYNEEISAKMSTISAGLAVYDHLKIDEIKRNINI